MLFAGYLKAQPPATASSSELLLQLKKIQTTGAVLYIAAHPDDENTRLIACLANEFGLRTGYLSLTRGDGGQNLIGSEQGIELGVIRTQELLAARKIDGGEQYFTRARDFGYSKTASETLEKWNRDSILADMVWVIRNFKPDVIITRFATDGSGGHGHHTASAILAEEAFDAAADARKFPEQLAKVNVWKTSRLFWNVSTRFANPNADMSPYLKLNVGGFNPLLGKSYGEIAAESRSMHKSQGFGSARQRGDYFEYFKPIKGDTNRLNGIFDRLDFTWNRWSNFKGTGNRISRLIKNFDPLSPQLCVAELSSILNELEQKREPEQIYHMNLIADFVQKSCGYLVDGLALDPYHAVGQPLRIMVQKLYRNRLDSILPGVLRTDTVTITPGATTPHYWLKETPDEYTYKCSSPEELLHTRDQTYTNQIKGAHFFKPASRALELTYPVQYKWTDPEKGECYRPLMITPPVMILVNQTSLLFPDASVREVTVQIKAGKDSVNGVFRVALPKGWYIERKGSKLKGKLKSPDEFGTTFSIAKKGETESFILEITPPSNPGTAEVEFKVGIGDQEYTKGIREIKYDHIPIQTLFPEAELKLVRLDVNRKSKRIGYIPGAGDEVASCMAQLGYEVVVLSDELLAKGDLSSFKAIICGIRAFNTNENLMSFKPLLMKYIKDGGNFIVQYNTNSFAGPLKNDIGPFPFKITRDRITDENARVSFNLPDHPVLNFPNRLSGTDFENWVQERSIYHAGGWSDPFIAPFRMNDPGEGPNDGAMIIAPLGKGNFVYTGFSFFRQLPAGIPGAFRLMVNLIEMNH